MKKRNLAVACFAALFLAQPAFVAAEEAMLIQHEVVATSPADGGTFVTLNMTVSNTGTSALDNTILAMTGPTTVLSGDGSTLALGTLTVGANSSQVWTFTVSETEQVESMLSGNIQIVIDATDSSGTTVSLNTISTGSTK